MTVKLEIWNGSLKGRVLEFKEHDVFIFGRSTDCHYALPSDPYVSRHHFLLEVNPPVCVVRDLSSLNGIRVNGTQYGGQTPGASEGLIQDVEVKLKHRDVIQVGETVFRVSVGDSIPCSKCKEKIAPEAQSKGMWAGESFYCACCCDILIHSHPTKALRNPPALPPSAVSTEMLRIEPAHKDRPVRGPRPTLLDRKRLEETSDSEKRCSHCGRLVSGGSPLTVDDQPLCPSCCEQALKNANFPTPPPKGYSATVRAQNPPGDLLPQFPDYQVIRLLGRGGMGLVYLARRKSDGRDLALKVMIRKKDQVHLRDVKRFFREIEICKQFDHPNIVAFEDQGETEGRFYFAMEYCPEGNVKELMIQRGGTLSHGEAIPLILQALDGLAYAHEKDIVHRDLKSENVLLAKKNNALIAKVADFGLAKSFQNAGLSGITLAREAVGTCGFMPREQIIDFRNAKPLTDIFSIGATLYHMLTGEYVYNFKARSDPLQVVLEGLIVPIRERDPSIDRKLAGVIDRAVKKDPEARHPTAKAFQKALAWAAQQ